jgi:hypothetical protein
MPLVRVLSQPLLTKKKLSTPLSSYSSTPIGPPSGDALFQYTSPLLSSSPKGLLRALIFSSQSKYSGVGGHAALAIMILFASCKFQPFVSQPSSTCVAFSLSFFEDCSLLSLFYFFAQTAEALIFFLSSSCAIFLSYGINTVSNRPSRDKKNTKVEKGKTLGGEKGSLGLTAILVQLQWVNKTGDEASTKGMFIYSRYD